MPDDEPRGPAAVWLAVAFFWMTLIVCFAAQDLIGQFFKVFKISS